MAVCPPHDKMGRCRLEPLNKNGSRLTIVPATGYQHGVVASEIECLDLVTVVAGVCARAT